MPIDDEEIYHIRPPRLPLCQRCAWLGRETLAGYADCCAGHGNVFALSERLESCEDFHEMSGAYAWALLEDGELEWLAPSFDDAMRRMDDDGLVLRDGHWETVDGFGCKTLEAVPWLR